tara:strand:+ start:384 stop:548 length:165 start_codon:yes stop_codon:yes gene_type:complete
MVKVILKLNLVHLLVESRNFRNDGWCQQGYREKYKEALKKYIMSYPSLPDTPRE